MMDEFPAYLEYKEIRRRVERRLNLGHSLVVHLVVYLCGLLALVLPNARLDYSYTDYQNGIHFTADMYIGPGIGLLFLAWSLALVVHAGLAYRRSGAAGAARESAVETELRERLAADDTTLLADRRQGFRVYSLLNEDIRIRSGIVSAVVLAALFNAAVWGNWLTAGGRLTDAWHGALLAALAGPLLLLLVNSVARRRQEKKILRTMANWNTQAEYVKRKRQQPAEALYDPAEMADDGELIEWRGALFSQDEEKAKR